MTIKITGKSSIVEQLLAEELKKKGFQVEADLTEAKRDGEGFYTGMKTADGFHPSNGEYKTKEEAKKDLEPGETVVYGYPLPNRTIKIIPVPKQGNLF